MAPRTLSGDWSTFMDELVHELRTPLSAVVGFAELLRDGIVGATEQERHRYLDDILRSTGHVVAILDDALDLIQVEAGQLDFKPEPIDVDNLLEEATRSLQSVAARKRITMHVEADPTQGEVVADPERLKQVVVSYLSNALKFTGAGGRVSVRAGDDGSDGLRIEVEDTGPGIEPGDQQRIFEEFEQLEDTDAEDEEHGAGLGLALVKRLVEAQGGRVGVESTPGKGSTFFAVLPRSVS